MFNDVIMKECTLIRAHQLVPRRSEFPLVPRRRDIMLRRPRATDTEEDLLVFQESFLASGGKPAVSVVSSSSGTTAKAGEKRRQGSTQPEKDVVHMQTEGMHCLHMHRINLQEWHLAN